MAVDTATTVRLCGLFGTSHLPYEYDGYGAEYPHLSEMTDVALDILDNDPRGFFLMVEGGRIDHACHANDLPRAVLETVEFDAAVQSVIDWMGPRTDTLVVVTADHETGGLRVVEGNGEGEFPTVTWSTGGHTGDDVPVYATGPNADLVTGVFENTLIFEIIACQSPSVAEVKLLSSDEVRVQWGRAGPGAVYTVEFVESLPAGDWDAAPSAQPWPSTASDWTTVPAPGTGSVYYRVRIDGGP
jgi:alkaline phosphatase